MTDTIPTLHVNDHPLVKHKRTILSDVTTDSKTFRELIREITRLVLYEATRDLPVTPFTYRTPLEETIGSTISASVGVVPILRAGLGMVDAAIDAIPSAHVWHLGMYRDETTHQPVSYYNRLPEKNPDDIVFLLDPMLATGGSASDAITVLKDWGAPKITFVGILAAPEGARRVYADHPDVEMYVAALDRELDEHKYIRPGLGDAGDRLFDTLQH